MAVKKETKSKMALPLISIFLVIVLVMVMLFLGTSISDSFWQQAVEDSAEVTAQRAKVLQTVIDKDINQTESLLNFANRAFVVADDKYNSYEEISNFASRLTAKKSYYFMDDGRIYTSTGQRLSSVESNISSLLSGADSTVSEPYYDSSLSAEVIAVFCTVGEDSAQQVKSAVSVFLASGVYSDCLFNELGGSETYFVDSDGNSIFSPVSSGTTGSYKNLAEIMAAYGLTSETADDILANLDNEDYSARTLDGEKSRMIVGVSRVSTAHDWYAMTVVSTDTIAARTANVISETTVIGVFILMCFVSVLLLYYLNEKKHEKEINNAENFDPVARCSTQKKFEHDAAHLLERFPSLLYAMVYIDFVNFRYIDRIYGFRKSDELMSNTSRIIGKQLSHTDTYGRLSNGRMVLMASYRDKSEITDLLDRINNKLLEDFEPYNINRFRVKYTAGIFCVDRKVMMSVQDMVDCAIFAQQTTSPDDGAVYAYYSKNDRDKALNIAVIESTMEQALKDGEFIVYLQPKYNIQQRRVDGAEALVRWKKPDMGILSPDEFVPIFEKNGFISQVDRYVYEETCKYIKRNKDSGKRVLPISVNVSRASADGQSFLEYYINTKNKYGIADNFIELEFTESLAMDSYEFLSETISVLRRNGFSCSIDDFGEGYSSFKALKALPFNIIKLDKFFLKKTSDHERDLMLLTSVISMARDLKMKVIVEGVETEEEMNMLRGMKCDCIQGYYCSKPMPLEDFNLFVEKSFERPDITRRTGHALNE